MFAIMLRPVLMQIFSKISFFNNYSRDLGVVKFALTIKKFKLIFTSILDSDCLIGLSCKGALNFFVISILIFISSVL